MKLLFWLLVILNILDALFTGMNIERHGLAIEANPLYLWSIPIFGIGSIWLIKTFYLIALGIGIHRKEVPSWVNPVLAIVILIYIPIVYLHAKILLG